MRIEQNKKIGFERKLLIDTQEPSANAAYCLHVGDGGEILLDMALYFMGDIWPIHIIATLKEWERIANRVQRARESRAIPPPPQADRDIRLTD